MINKIMGVSVKTHLQLSAQVLNVNPDAKRIEDIAGAYIRIGKRYGVRGDVAFAQAIVETGWFTFRGSAVTPDQHNYCGMGVTSTGLKGNEFRTIEEGVTAHIQHLFAYATTLPLPEGDSILDPRFRYVKRGIAPTWKDLNNRWAMNDKYAGTIESVYDLL